MSPGHGPHYWQECVSGHWDMKFGGAFASVFWGGEPEVRITAAFPNTGSCFNSNDFGYLGFLDAVCATKFVSRPVVSNIFFLNFHRERMIQLDGQAKRIFFQMGC